MRFQSGAEDIESLGELPVQFFIQRLHSNVQEDSNSKPKMQAWHVQASFHSNLMVCPGTSPMGTAMHV